MSEIIRRRLALGAALLLAPFLALSPAVAYQGDPDGEDFPGQQERREQEREQRERAEQERQQHEDARTAEQTTWSIAPARDADDEEAEHRVSLRMEIEPGQSASDAVTVTNYSTRAATFVVYASDGIVTSDGQFDVLPSATAPTEAGSWVSVGEGAPGEAITVEIDAESDVTLPVQITVPADATPGDHPAGVVASLATGAGGVGMESRVGTRIHLRVAGDLEPTLAVGEVRARYDFSWNPFSPGTLHLEYLLENTGNIRLGGESEASGSSFLGLGERSGPGTGHREVLPGQEARSTVVLENVWPLIRYTGEIQTVPITVGQDVVEVPLEPGTTAWSSWTLPWIHLAAVVLALGTLIMRRRMRRRREAATQARIDAAVAKARSESRVPAEA